MKEFKGTKWVAKDLYNNWLIVDEKTDTIVEIRDNKENAHLIATAPELLEACISAKNYLQALYESNELAPFPTRSELDRLNEAIKKALGL